MFKVLHAFPALLGLKRPAFQQEAEAVYRQLTAQARNPVFYEDYGVPDTVEGRFDVLAVHAFAVLLRVREVDENGRFGQALFNTMFSNLDANLREMGVGDTRVGKRVRAFAEMFFGRARAYEAALNEEDETILIDALSRNVYGLEGASEAPHLARYLRESVHGQGDAGDLLKGKVDFPDPVMEKSVD